jgi:hypothetical protein
LFGRLNPIDGNVGVDDEDDDMVDVQSDVDIE